MDNRVGNGRSPSVRKIEPEKNSPANKGSKQPKHSTPVKSATLDKSFSKDTNPSVGQTPVSDNSMIYNKRSLMEGELKASHLSIKKSPDNTTELQKSRKGKKDFSEKPNQSASPPMNGMTSSMQAKLTEFENGTIAKQRGEIQLLVTELRDRDRELNDMVLSHQRQLAAWDHDRQKVQTLEEKCNKLERSLQERNDNYRTVVAKLRTVESEDLNRSTALNHTQTQLAEITEQHSHLNSQLLDATSANRSLNSTVHDLSSTVGQLEAREQELLTVLKLKDRDLSESSSRAEELNAKLLRLDGLYQTSRDSEMTLRREVTEWRNKYQEAMREVDLLKRELLQMESESDQRQLEAHKLKQELATSRKEVLISNEREKRKDQLLDLQRSKQERSDAELSNLRHLYERQQKDLSLLHMNLENTKELLNKQNRLYSARSFNLSDSFESSFGKSPITSPERPYSRSRETSGISRTPERPYPRSQETSRISRTPERPYSRSSEISPSRMYSRSPSRLTRSPSPGFSLMDRGRGYSREQSPGFNRSTYNHQVDCGHSPYRSTSPASTSPARMTYTERSRSPGYRYSSSFAAETTKSQARPRGYAYNRSTSPGAVLRRAQLQSDDLLADQTSDSPYKRSPQTETKEADEFNKKVDIRKTQSLRVGSVSNGIQEDEKKTKNGHSVRESITGGSCLDKTSLSSSSSSVVSEPGEKEDALKEAPADAGTSHAENFASGTGSTASSQNQSPDEATYDDNDLQQSDRSSQSSARYDAVSRESSRTSSRHSNGGRNESGQDNEVTQDMTTDTLDETGEVAAIFGDAGPLGGDFGQAKREITPVNVDSASSIASSSVLSLQSSVRETDSPGTKLHKLLTESRDMVEELEKSATSAESSPRDRTNSQTQA